MTKYIIGEFFSSGGATLYKKPSDQTVYQASTQALWSRHYMKEKYPIDFSLQNIKAGWYIKP